jgi:hypothetical protein
MEVEDDPAWSSVDSVEDADGLDNISTCAEQAIVCAWYSCVMYVIEYSRYIGVALVMLVPSGFIAKCFIELKG